MRETHKMTKRKKRRESHREGGHNLSATIHIHESLLQEIFSKLPVKSLLRFKRICKSWYTLITSPEFISMHFKNNASAYLLIDNSYNVNRLTIGTNFSARSLSLPTTLEFNPKIYNPVRLYGPCNGIVCLYKGVDKIVLWNPATKESKLLPRSKISRLPLCDDFFNAEVGFGYDAKTDDYKILQTVTFNEGGVQFELYSLRGDYWKKLKPTTYVPPSYDSRGATSLSYQNSIIICWLADDDKRGDEWQIVSFDMSNENFDFIRLPSDIAAPDSDVEEELSLELFTFKESIAISRFDYEREQLFDIWVSENLFAGPNSWIKLMSVDLNYVRPLGFCEDGKILFQGMDYSEMILYNPLTEEIMDLERYGYYFSFKALAFKESLVKISSKNASIQQPKHL